MKKMQLNLEAFSRVTSEAIRRIERKRDNARCVEISARLDREISGLDTALSIACYLVEEKLTDEEILSSIGLGEPGTYYPKFLVTQAEYEATPPKERQNYEVNEAALEPPRTFSFPDED